LLVPGRRRLRALLARPRQASKQGGIEIRCALVLGGAGTASQRGQMSRQYSAERSRDMSRCSHGGDEPGSDVWNTAKQPAQSAAVVWNIAKRPAQSAAVVWNIAKRPAQSAAVVWNIAKRPAQSAAVVWNIAK